MTITLTDDLRQLLKEKVESGQFPDEESVVKEAICRFLGESTIREQPRPRPATKFIEERLPGPFLEDEMAVGPMDLPRPGLAVPTRTIQVTSREPSPFPEE
jgi:Arc/MetJ-type ribon-helix-helix transcriptional regulator